VSQGAITVIASAQSSLAGLCTILCYAGVRPIQASRLVALSRYDQRHMPVMLSQPRVRYSLRMPILGTKFTAVPCCLCDMRPMEGQVKFISLQQLSLFTRSVLILLSTVEAVDLCS